MLKQLRFFVFAVSIIVSTGITSVSLRAQSSAQIQGTVSDPSGSAVPGAEITATQTDTGAVRKTASGADGGYVLPNLPIGPYRLEVSRMGFTTYVQTGIVLQVASNPSVDIQMKVGAVTEQVQVEANAALVETEKTGVGSVIENQRILELPLNGRNAVDLIQLAGAAIPVMQGVSTIPGSQSISVAGGQTFGVSYQLDGSNFNDPFDGTSLPFPFPDALQEFKVASSSLTAENGEHSGAAINAVTKSGTNAFHGDVFEFLRNGAVNARNFFAVTPDTLKRNQFGGTIGGPIIKNKVFFFFGYQGTKTRQAPTGNITFVPTPAMLKGDFRAYLACNPTLGHLSTLGFSGDQINPNLFSKQALALVAKLPTPTNACGQVNYGVGYDPNQDQYVSRFDYQVNDKHSLFGRYIATSFQLPPADTLPGASILSSGGAGQDALAQSLVFGENWLISSTIVNSFRASVGRMANHQNNGDFVSGCDLGVNIFCYLPHIAQFNVTGGFVLGGALAAPSFGLRTTFALNDDVSIVRGSHQFSFGVSAEQFKAASGGNVYSQTSFAFSGIATKSPTTSGVGMADFLLGQLSTFSEGAQRAAFFGKYFVGLYARDTWKVTPKFTVNLGIRWEPFLPESQYNGAVYNFNLPGFYAGTRTSQFNNAPPGLTFPGDPGFAGKAGINHQWNLFAPRVGIAWDPKGDGKMSIRASYGLAYDFPNEQFFNNVSSAPPWTNLTTVNGPVDFANPWSAAPTSNIFPFVINKNVPFVPGGTYVALNPNLKTTEVHQWNLSIQRQFSNDWLVSATYIGSETEHLWGSYQINPATLVPNTAINPATGLPYPLGSTACPPTSTGCNATTNTNARRLLALTNPAVGKAFGFLDTIADGGTASYNGLLLNVQKRLSKGISINANYTWAHCIGDQSTGSALPGGGGGYTIPNNRRFDRGACSSSSALVGLLSSDRRQIFNLTSAFQTPRFANNTERILASGWKLAVIYRATSGPSLNVTTGVDLALNGQTNERPNQINGNPLCANPNASCWINPAAFQAPAFGTVGNMGSNNVPGPGFFQLDTALSREFRIREKGTLEFRGEAFNLTNSFRAGGLAAGLPSGTSGVTLTQNSANFGRILSALDPRILQFALKFVF